MSVFADYAAYYDEMYADKDYVAEASYIGNLVRDHAQSGPISILRPRIRNRQTRDRACLTRVFDTRHRSQPDDGRHCRGEEIVPTGAPERKCGFFRRRRAVAPTWRSI